MKCPQCGYTTSSVSEQSESATPWTSLSEEESHETAAPERAEEIRWGGFWRRLSAFSIDLLIIDILSSLLFYLSYVGYSVGLAAHGRELSSENLNFFLLILFFAWLSLVAGYFILFHGMEGRTIGKGLRGLRVVGANRSRITYRQALIRWIGFLPSAISGLGVLWILWDREKRGWHDRLARTWVIRE
jgi:uncharacterized RDD family membrane protein YckC